MSCSTRYLPVLAILSLLALSACDSGSDHSIAGDYTLVSLTSADGFFPGSSTTTIAAGQPLVGEIGGIQITITITGTLTFTETGTFRLAVFFTQESSLGMGTESDEETGTYEESGGTGTMATSQESFTFTVSGDRVTISEPESNTIVVFERD